MVAVLVSDAMGLSPRVRGSRRDVLNLLQTDGSIPACAGEPQDRGDDAIDDRVYPRVCGGADQVEHWLDTCTGLSPRVRGSPSHRADQP